jgi:uncharacterized OsmC-like protein
MPLRFAPCRRRSRSAATGGSGLELCSGDMLLEALVACAGVTLKAVATALDIPLKTGSVSAEGDLDFRGTLGVAKDAPVGFAQIRLMFEVETDAPQEKLDQLLKLTERYCVVYQTLRNARRWTCGCSGGRPLVLGVPPAISACPECRPSFGSFSSSRSRWRWPRPSW